MKSSAIFKKLGFLAVILLTLVYIVLPAIAESEQISEQDKETSKTEIEIPKFSDFCPKEFLEIKVLTSQEYSKLYLKGIVPPTPKMLEAHNKKAVYWAERKKHFDAHVNVCKRLPKNKQEVCFDKISDSQYLENKKINLTPEGKAVEQAIQDARLQHNQQLMIRNEMRKMNPLMQ